MSENPYAPPRAVLAAPQTLAEGSGAVDLGRCMQEGWRDTWANFPLWLGAGIVWLIATIATVAPIVSIIGSGIGAAAVAAFLAILLVAPVLYWGAYAFFLKMHDGGARLADLFSGFARFGQAFVGMTGYFIVSTAVGIPAQVLTQLGARSPDRGWLLAVGYLLAIATLVFVQSRLNFAPLLIVDRQLGLGEALSQSWSRTSELKGPLALLTLIMMLAIAASVLVLIVGVIPGTVFGFLLWVSAYRQIFGGARSS